MSHHAGWGHWGVMQGLTTVVQASLKLTTSCISPSVLGLQQEETIPSHSLFLITKVLLAQLKTKFNGKQREGNLVGKKNRSASSGKP